MNSIRLIAAKASNEINKVFSLFIRLITITCNKFQHNELPLRSSAMTFTMLLALVPMLAMSTALVKGLGGDNQLKNIAYSYIDTLENSEGFHLPRFGIKETKTPLSTGEESLTSWLREAVEQLFGYVDKTNFATLGSFGVVGILITVLLMLNHIETAMNTIWNVEAGRSLIRKLSDYITLLILFPLSINIAFATTALLKHPEMAEKLDTIIPFEWLQTLIFQAVPVLFVTLSLFAMYIFFPNTKVKSIPAIVGASIAAALWFITQNFYINLQIGVAKYNAIYGTFASAPLFLVWIYLGWLFILLGAQLAWGLQNINSIPLKEYKSSPALQLAAAFDISQTIYKNFANNTPIMPQELSNSLSYDRKLSKAVIEKFLTADMFHLAQEDGRLLPSRPEVHLGKEEIIRFILGGKTPNSQGGKVSQLVIDTACGTATTTKQEKRIKDKNLRRETKEEKRINKNS